MIKLNLQPDIKDELIGSQFLPLKHKYPLTRGKKHVKTNVNI